MQTDMCGYSDSCFQYSHRYGQDMDAGFLQFHLRLSDLCHCWFSCRKLIIVYPDFSLTTTFALPDFAR